LSSSDQKATKKIKDLHITWIHGDHHLLFTNIHEEGDNNAIDLVI